jgi:hypothetical protein
MVSWQRNQPTPPKSDPPSVLLMRALGDLCLDYEVEAIDDMDALAIMSGIAYVDLPALIEVGITAGYIKDEENGEIGLTPKGWAWFTRDLEKREG